MIETSQHLAQLCDKTLITEVEANQVEIFCWHHYGRNFVFQEKALYLIQMIILASSQTTQLLLTMRMRCIWISCAVSTSSLYFFCDLTTPLYHVIVYNRSHLLLAHYVITNQINFKSEHDSWTRVNLRLSCIHAIGGTRDFTGPEFFYHVKWHVSICWYRPDIVRPSKQQPIKELLSIKYS